VAADFFAGAASGDLIGLTNGLSLLQTVAADAVINAGIESYRQLANSAITGCQKEDLRGIVVAAATSVLRDAAGTGAAWVRDCFLDSRLQLRCDLRQR
jgi:hypothetical protein